MSLDETSCNSARGGAGYNGRAEEVRRLLAAGEDDAALVAIEVRVEVATPAELDSPPYRGALQIATRQEVARRAGGEQLSDR